MAKILVKRNNVPLKAYLRADPNSQHFIYIDDSANFVTPEMFWGTKEKPGLYLEYSQIDGRSIDVSMGISENLYSQTLHNQDCDEWINKNIICSNSSRLFVVQGYAGCGKTTFINYIKKESNASLESIITIDIGKNWSFPSEPELFYKESMSALRDALNGIAGLGLIRDKIWDEFVRLGTVPEVKTFDSSLFGTVSKLDKIKKTCQTWDRLIIDIIQNLNDRYGGSRKETETIWHNTGNTQIVVALLILLKCAEKIVLSKLYSELDSFTLIFDNLDVITNPAIPAENVLLLWGVVSHFVNFKNSLQEKGQEMPDVHVIITVRKVMYSHIISHLPDLEMTAMNDPRDVYICDISKLYRSQAVIDHRVDYWMNSEYTRNNHIIAEKLKQVKNIAKISKETPSKKDNDDEYSPKRAINLEAFVNYNFRAYSNIMSEILDKPNYKSILVKLNKSSKPWMRVATIVFVLSLLYKKDGIWNTLGFGCADFKCIDYPTTLNRLILNYLYAAKQGQNLSKYAINRSDITTRSDVQLCEILNVFKSVKFLRINTELSQDEIDKEYMVTNADAEQLVLERLADMCARKFRSSDAKALGYDSDENELWRRPLYFTGGLKLYHTASNYDELLKNFKDKISSNMANKVLFSITDEGFTLINDFVANFEFYSARYGSDTARPLYQATSKDEIDALIGPVYSAVMKCCQRNKIFMNQYMEQYGLSINRYLNMNFHPRTKPRFEKEHGNVILQDGSYRPQLHIVRVIYSHIGYFNVVKEHVSKSNLKGKKQMCECLTRWIKDYLTLYSENFYKILWDTICNPDNLVYTDLSKRLEEQEKQYQEGGSGENIDISVQRRKEQEITQE